MEAVAFADGPAAEVGVRLISVDRPGMGISTMVPQRAVADFAETAALVADRFGVGQFAVLGASGGGPYALACAARLPDRVSKAVLVSSLAPLESAPKGAKGAGGLMVLRRFPFLARPAAARMAQVVRKPRGLAAMMGQMSAPDRERLDTDERVRSQVANNILTAFETGSRGVAQDLQLLFARPWGFDLADIGVPVEIWHGDADTNVPVEGAERLAAALPNATVEIVPGFGHLLFVDRSVQILTSLLRGVHTQ